MSVLDLALSVYARLKSEGPSYERDEINEIRVPEVVPEVPAAGTLANVSGLPLEVSDSLLAPELSVLDMTPDLLEHWQERTCIMFVDGRLPWPEAERLALADVLQHAGPVLTPAAAADADEPALVQRGLFAKETTGPY